ncbi:MAG: hypothetical protein HYS12_12705 [Planctomycetes bacterium]|nr:hypothetical protein [Planctomycetota bacterium]
MSNPLEALARRVEDNPFFLASVLARYAQAERLDDTGLAKTLGCTPETLTALRLCRTPRTEAPGFGEDVDCIAARFNLDGDRLAEVVRHGQALEHMAGPSASRGTLLAARDAQEDQASEPPEEGP